MRMSATSVRRGLYGAFATCALGGVAAATIALPTANAAPMQRERLRDNGQRRAKPAGGYLDTHPEADKVLTTAGVQGADAETSVRDYFVAHPQELTDLRGIAQPLIDMQQQCNTAVSPMEIAALFQALSQSRPRAMSARLHAAVAAAHEAVDAEGGDTERRHDE